MSYTVDKVDINGKKMGYMHFGTVGKPIVVMIPGLSIQSVLNSAAAVEKQYAALAESFDVYLFDRKEDVELGYSIEDMARDTIFAMQTLGIEKANIVGVSQGGMIAQKIALINPSIINSLVLCSTSPEVNPHDEGITNWIELAKAKEKEKLLDCFFQQVYTQEFYDSHKRAVRMFARMISDKDLERFVILATPILGFNVMNEFNNVKVPILVCGSKQDKVVPFWCIEDLIKLTNAETLILEDGSHALYDESPLFVPAIVEFFNKHN